MDEEYIDVIYEDGVFKPLKKIDLPRGMRIRMKIVKSSNGLSNIIEKLSKEYASVDKDPLKHFLRERR